MSHKFPQIGDKDPQPLMNEEEEDEDEDDILDELILEPFDYTAAQMKEFFNGYKKSISDGILKTFNCNIDMLIETANSGPDSCWL